MHHPTTAQFAGRSTVSNSSAGHRLAVLLRPAIEQIGVDLEDVEVASAGKRRLVRVLVDSDAGVSLDEVSAASQAISAVLDAPAADAILGSAPYVLEVSSPGVDRPLTKPKHWRRSVGRLVRVSLTAGGEIQGRVIEAADDGVRLASSDELKGSKSNPDSVRALSFDEIVAGRVQVEFNRPGQPAPDDTADADVDVDGPDDETHSDFHAEESQ
jgi:ribosome maturation factor RimP